MSARSINKVLLIGNLTRDPELRYTPQGTPVASFGLATNREWVVNGAKKEAADFHNVVAWNKLGELCAQLLKKGTKVYVEGRLQTRDWVDTEGVKKYKTEVVIDEMIVLTAGKKSEDGGDTEFSDTDQQGGSDATPEDGELNLDEVLGDLDSSN
ncbi:single-stranded DNA-binding protein [Patescibacteria group bacterium]|nr:single-stranded DNA-binding protein [Patescibacteria group bacterium]